jgi:hypothetical protein
MEHDDVSASFDLAAARAWVFYNPKNEAVFRPCLGVGAGVLVPWSKGDASGTYVSKLDQTVIGYIGVAGHVAIYLGHYIRLTIGIQAGLALPDIAIKFGSHEIASFGLPMLEGFLSAGLVL